MMIREYKHLIGLQHIHPVLSMWKWNEICNAKKDESQTFRSESQALRSESQILRSESQALRNESITRKNELQALGN